MRWLEIDESGTVIGIHSVQCQSDNTWEEYDGEAELGDQWKNGKLIRRTQPSIKSQLMNPVFRRNYAEQVITYFYPLWNQLNILRDNDPEKVERMGRFIDQVRQWSNEKRSSAKKIERLIQEYFPDSPAPSWLIQC